MCRKMLPGRVVAQCVLLCAFLFLSRQGFAQANTITIHFDCGQVEVGQQICVPVRVDNFENITVFSLHVTWDPTILKFVGLQNEQFPVQAAWNLPGPSDLRYIWSEPNADWVDLPDDAILFELCFEAIGAPGTSSPISVPPFVLNPYNTTEFADSNNNVVPTQEIPCVIDVINPQVVLALIDICGSPDGIAPGSFTVTAAGGSAPYTYSWTGPVTGNSNIASPGGSESQSVPPGNYTITIMDNAGGTQVYNITIGAAELTPVITVIREITCYEFSNGRIEVGAFSGVTPISILWKNLDNALYHGSGYLQSSGSAYLLNSLPVGRYVITLIDDNGCTRDDTVTLSASPIVINSMTTNATCLGEMDGSVQIGFSGGRPYQGGVYEVSTGWMGGSFMTTSPLISAPVFGPGDYWVEVCDSINNCCVRDTFTVGADVVITGNFTVESPACAGTSQGEIRVNGLTNGAIVGPYNIQLFNSAKLPVQPAIDNVTLVRFMNLAAGNYFVVVKEGMCRSDTMPVTIPPTEPIVIDVLAVGASGCVIGQNSGSISVSASGGTPGYTYSWDGGAHMGAMVNNLSSGNHFLTVTDNNGCTRQMTINVPQAVGPMIDEIIATNLGCSGGDATLEVVFTEGTAPVTKIQWSTGDTTAVITNVGPGIVNVTIRDSLFCFDIEAFEVPQMPEIVVDSVVVTSPTCGGDADGMVAVFPSGGTEPYTYYWSTGDTTTFNLLAGLTAGDYSVTIVDSDTCDIRKDTMFSLMDPPIPTFVFDPVTPATCFDACDGAATLTPTGGFPGFPYTFMWDAGLMQNGMQSTASNLCPGYQRVIITQDNLCFYVDSVLIPAPDSIAYDTIAVDNVTCFGANNGRISIQGTGGSGGFQYNWDIPATGPDQTGLQSGIYTVTITDNAGCTSEHEIAINEPDSLILEIDQASVRPISCNFANSGIIGLTVTGGNGGYQFNWNPNISTDFIATGVAAGLYSITVTDDQGCTDTTSILMSGPAPVVGFLPIIEDPLCFAGFTTVTVDSASGGNGGYSWSVNGGQPHELQEPFMLPAGIYNIITQDSTGCRDTTQIILTNPDPIEISVLPENPIVDLGDSVLIEITISGNQSPIDSILWTPGGTLSCNNCTDPYASNVIPTLYTVTAWDSNGCMGALDVLVDVNNKRQVYIPNVFTPNFDGRNDRFVIQVGQGITAIPALRVFDRWGELVMEQRDVFPDPAGVEVWDGSFKGKMMTPGVYVYMIEVKFADNQTLIYRGDVTLIR